VDGEPRFDPETNTLHFVVANIPNSNDEIREQGGLAAVLHYAVNDPNATRLAVEAHNTEIPDLLQHEAQAIMSGTLEFRDGQPVFLADEITLKCPTKYEDEVPEQIASE
jgi:cytochrome c-type biogenesis protein CcmE